jgi:hypothetical protein
MSSRGASSPGLNRPTFKMEKQRGGIREDEAYSIGK